jgi:hypothetical protein
MANYQQVITAATLVHTGAGYLAGLVISADGTTPLTATFYNNTAGSGTIIFQVHISPECSSPSKSSSDHFALHYRLYVAVVAYVDQSMKRV